MFGVCQCFLHGDPWVFERSGPCDRGVVDVDVWELVDFFGVNKVA